ncbi:hypothetical protein CKAN_01763400 [Cinnamomum micranthum f. kanehirae]|uniref:Uncharacterized protein n=1 Tax=Cinnamomum micranthum f. kanehirae TaxID=337451 RepID=A0A3S4PCL6_9MAGN|nr:hypothetical protein CKAN_01763400 [Cinnamomum micranthum f. kanehirae]
MCAAAGEIRQVSEREMCAAAGRSGECAAAGSCGKGGRSIRQRAEARERITAGFSASVLSIALYLWRVVDSRLLAFPTPFTSWRTVSARVFCSC